MRKGRPVRRSTASVQTAKTTETGSSEPIGPGPLRAGGVRVPCRRLSFQEVPPVAVCLPLPLAGVWDY